MELTITEMWETHKKVHRLNFTVLEDQRRFLIFQDNKKYVDLLNSQNLGYEVELNKFAHLEHSEFLNLYTMKQKVLEREESEEGEIKRSEFQNFSDVDWRLSGLVSPVKDQGICGSCYSMSAVGAIEGAYARRHNTIVDISVQQIVDCSKPFGNQGCQGGWMENSFEFVAQEGISTSYDYPYVDQDKSCDKRVDIFLYIKGHVRLPARDEVSLGRAISRYGVVSAGIDATHRSFMFYKRGIYYSEGCGAELMNHAVLIVGMGSKPREHYIVKNSYGRGWGDDGYVLMARNRNNNCAIASYALYPVL